MWQAGWHFTLWHHITCFSFFHFLFPRLCLPPLFFLRLFCRLSTLLLFDIFIFPPSFFFFAFLPNFNALLFFNNCLFSLFLFRFIANSFASTFSMRLMAVLRDSNRAAWVYSVCVSVRARAHACYGVSCYSDIFLGFLYNNILLHLLRCDGIIQFVRISRASNCLLCCDITEALSHLYLVLIKAPVCKTVDKWNHYLDSVLHY